MDDGTSGRLDFDGFDPASFFQVRFHEYVFVRHLPGRRNGDGFRQLDDEFRLSDLPVGGKRARLRGIGWIAFREIVFQPGDQVCFVIC